eukprot:scaffold247147_cov21-Tisochrysis_lutea.AAC.1
MPCTSSLAAAVHVWEKSLKGDLSASALGCLQAVSKWHQEAHEVLCCRTQIQSQASSQQLKRQ